MLDLSLIRCSYEIVLLENSSGMNRTMSVKYCGRLQMHWDHRRRIHLPHLDLARHVVTPKNEVM